MNTRLRKLDNFEEFGYDAIVVAAAGLKRMGREGRISHALDTEVCLPAAGQGRLAVECREDDEDTMRVLDVVRDRGGTVCSHAERAFLAALGGGCQVPIAALASVSEEKEGKSTLSMQGNVLSLEGDQRIVVTDSLIVTWADGDSAVRDAALLLGTRMAKTAIEQGARDVLDSIQRQP